MSHFLEKVFKQIQKNYWKLYFMQYTSDERCVIGDMTSCGSTEDFFVKLFGFYDTSLYSRIGILEVEKILSSEEEIVFQRIQTHGADYINHIFFLVRCGTKSYILQSFQNVYTFAGSSGFIELDKEELKIFDMCIRLYEKFENEDVSKTKNEIKNVNKLLQRFFGVDLRLEPLANSFDTLEERYISIDSKKIGLKDFLEIIKENLTLLMHKNYTNTKFKFFKTLFDANYEDKFCTRDGSIIEEKFEKLTGISSNVLSQKECSKQKIYNYVNILTFIKLDLVEIKKSINKIIDFLENFESKPIKKKHLIGKELFEKSYKSISPIKSPKNYIL